MKPVISNTFRDDFIIAEGFGEKAVRDTYKRCQEWKGDVEMFGALVITLNHRIWDLYETNEPMARVYNELWSEAHRFAQETFKGDDARRYFELTD